MQNYGCNGRLKDKEYKVIVMCCPIYLKLEIRVQSVFKRMGQH